MAGRSLTNAVLTLAAVMRGRVAGLRPNHGIGHRFGAHHDAQGDKKL
jgi:hypothetical protein